MVHTNVFIPVWVGLRCFVSVKINDKRLAGAKTRRDTREKLPCV
jgi:hypothetical protein